MIERTSFGPSGPSDGFLSYPLIHENVRTKKLDGLAERYRSLRKQLEVATSEALDLRDQIHDNEARRADIKAAVDATDPRTGEMPDVATKHRSDLTLRRQQASDKVIALEEASKIAQNNLYEAITAASKDPKLGQRVEDARALAVESLRASSEALEDLFEMESTQRWMHGPGVPLRRFDVIRQTAGAVRASLFLSELATAITPEDQEGN